MKLTSEETEELQALGKQPRRTPELKRRFARLTFKAAVPDELWKRLVTARADEQDAAVRVKSCMAELEKLAPADDEHDVLWHVGDLAVAESKELASKASKKGS
jgi:hypothetical protein